MSFYDLASTLDLPSPPTLERPGTVVAGSGNKGPFASLGTGTSAAHESAGSDEGAGATAAIGIRTPDAEGPRKPAPAPGELPKYPGLFRRILRTCSTEALIEAIDAASLAGLTLAEYVEARADATVAQLVRDAAPVALRELRRVRS